MTLRNTFLSGACRSAALGSVSAVKKCYSVLVGCRSACDTTNFRKAVCNSFPEKFSPFYVVSVLRTAVKWIWAASVQLLRF